MSKRSNGEGSFYERRDDKGKVIGYLYRVMVNGQRVSGSGRTKAIAKSAALDRARLVADRPARETFKQ